MEPNLEGWTIVIAGAWNQAIFTPPWIAKHLLSEERDVQVELGIAFMAVERLMKFPTRDVSLSISPERLIIQPSRLTRAALETANNCAHKVLTTLQHTPIAAIGLNCTYQTDDPPSGIIRALQLGDSEELSHCRLDVQEARIARTLKCDGVPGDPVLNLSMSRDHSTSHCDVAFNYHYAGGPAASLAGRIAGVFIQLRDHSFGVLRAYGDTSPEVPLQ